MREGSSVRVALRDASGYRTHRQTTGASYAHVPVWHAVNPADPFYSRCGKAIDSATERAHHGVLARCGRPGCRQAYAAAEARS